MAREINAELLDAKIEKAQEDMRDVRRANPRDYEHVNFQHEMPLGLLWTGNSG